MGRRKEGRAGRKGSVYNLQLEPPEDPEIKKVRNSLHSMGHTGRWSLLERIIIKEKKQDMKTKPHEDKKVVEAPETPKKPIAKVDSFRKPIERKNSVPRFSAAKIDPIDEALKKLSQKELELYMTPEELSRVRRMREFVNRSSGEKNDSRFLELLAASGEKQNSLATSLARMTGIAISRTEVAKPEQPTLSNAKVASRRNLIPRGPRRVSMIRLQMPEGFNANSPRVNTPIQAVLERKNSRQLQQTEEEAQKAEENRLNFFSEMKAAPKGDRRRLAAMQRANDAEYAFLRDGKRNPTPPEAEEGEEQGAGSLRFLERGRTQRRNSMLRAGQPSIFFLHEDSDETSDCSSPRKSTKSRRSTKKKRSPGGGGRGVKFEGEEDSTSSEDSSSEESSSSSSESFMTSESSSSSSSSEDSDSENSLKKKKRKSKKIGGFKARAAPKRSMHKGFVPVLPSTDPNKKTPKSASPKRATSAKTETTPSPPRQRKKKTKKPTEGKKTRRVTTTVPNFDHSEDADIQKMRRATWNAQKQRMESEAERIQQWILKEAEKTKKQTQKWEKQMGMSERMEMKAKESREERRLRKAKEMEEKEARRKAKKRDQVSKDILEREKLAKNIVFALSVDINKSAERLSMHGQAIGGTYLTRKQKYKKEKNVDAVKLVQSVYRKWKKKLRRQTPGVRKNTTGVVSIQASPNHDGTFELGILDDETLENIRLKSIQNLHAWRSSFELPERWLEDPEDSQDDHFDEEGQAILRSYDIPVHWEQFRKQNLRIPALVEDLVRHPNLSSPQPRVRPTMEKFPPAQQIHPDLRKEVGSPTRAVIGGEYLIKVDRDLPAQYGMFSPRSKLFKGGGFGYHDPTPARPGTSAVVTQHHQQKSRPRSVSPVVLTYDHHHQCHHHQTDVEEPGHIQHHLLHHQGTAEDLLMQLPPVEYVPAPCSPALIHGGRSAGARRSSPRSSRNARLLSPKQRVSLESTQPDLPILRRGRGEDSNIVLSGQQLRPHPYSQGYPDSLPDTRSSSKTTALSSQRPSHLSGTSPPRSPPKGAHQLQGGGSSVQTQHHQSPPRKESMQEAALHSPGIPPNTPDTSTQAASGELPLVPQGEMAKITEYPPNTSAKATAGNATSASLSARSPHRSLPTSVTSKSSHPTVSLGAVQSKQHARSTARETVSAGKKELSYSSVADELKSSQLSGIGLQLPGRGEASPQRPMTTVGQLKLPVANKGSSAGLGELQMGPARKLLASASSSVTEKVLPRGASVVVAMKSRTLPDVPNRPPSSLSHSAGAISTAYPVSSLPTLSKSANKRSSTSGAKPTTVMS